MKEAHTNILSTASAGLSKTFGQPVRLALDAELDSQHTVLRCRLVDGGIALPASVIIKQLLLEKASRTNQPSYLTRYRNEWATLRFLGELPGDIRIGPRVYFSDRQLGLMVVEDLGQRPSVQDLLYEDDPQTAGEALVLIGNGLGRLHAATSGLEMVYREMQGRFKANTPLSDATLDLRQYQDGLSDCFAALNIEAAGDFFGELAQVEAKIHGPGPFRALCHNDAGAHNFLLLDEHVKLLDFEFAGFQHALTDLVPARLGFPPSYRGRRSPPELIERLERAYRVRLSQTIPEADEDELFVQEREAACVHVVLAKLVGMWQVYLQHRLVLGAEYDDQGGRTPESTRYFRRMNLTYLTTYLEMSETAAVNPAIRHTLRLMADSLLLLWPELTPFPFYPAFEQSGSRRGS